jgi:hypothetical protein
MMGIELAIPRPRRNNPDESPSKSTTQPAKTRRARAAAEYENGHA